MTPLSFTTFYPDLSKQCAERLQHINNIGDTDLKHRNVDEYLVINLQVC